MTQNIGNFTVKSFYSLFVDSPSKNYYKNGELWAVSHNGNLFLIGRRHYQAPLTRAQGFKYWKRHFPNWFYFDLPELLQEAIDRPTERYGTYIDRNGEVVGYSA